MTEFLPVSSSGHLVLVQRLLDIGSPGVSLEVAAHAGTLVAILLVYGRDVLAIASAFLTGLFIPERRAHRDFRMAVMVILGSIPAAGVGVIFKGAIEKAFESPFAAGVGLLATGAILYSAPGRARRVRGGVPDVGTALWVGIAQAVSILPGISRSGATISAGLASGLPREDAARFSFLLAIPAVLGAMLLELVHLPAGSLASVEATATVAASSLISGLIALRVLLRFVKAGNLRPFAWYCWVVGAIALVLSAAR